MDSITIGQRLQNARVEHHLSQEDVSGFIGAAPTTVSRWETGQTLPSLRYQSPLCALYQKTHHELFGDSLPEEREDFVSSFPPISSASLAPLIELQITIPVSVLPAKELVELIQKNIRVNGKQMQQADMKIEEPAEGGNITITARLYAPSSSFPPMEPPAQIYPFVLKAPKEG